MLNEVLLAVTSGLIVGIFFTAVKLPIPAPPVLSGVMGIVGVYVGSIIYTKYISVLFS
ncbi:XapX domain-containing protein [Vibrio sp. DW001]|uniref:XapX domain-containing protein n=1 Tax=unclassified Vibrio TaxID=2614977 RepID=UPI0018A00B6C|nr:MULTISPECIES: XapX domain-containing protein [unclassified Vibrio]UGA55398.1 XapX domain-containing protein [Vibrio sp. VB16]WED27277.1 XapX domain-containing protein [Vibrio sp. DW001]